MMKKRKFGERLKQLFPWTLSLVGCLFMFNLILNGESSETFAKGKDKGRKEVQRAPTSTSAEKKADEQSDSKEEKVVRRVRTVSGLSSYSVTPFLVGTPHGDVLYPPVAMSDNGQFVVIILPDRILRSRDFGVTFQMSQVEMVPASDNRNPASFR